jgi:hypothetical protein
VTRPAWRHWGWVVGPPVGVVLVVVGVPWLTGGYHFWGTLTSGVYAVWTATRRSPERTPAVQPGWWVYPEFRAECAKLGAGFTAAACVCSLALAYLPPLAGFVVSATTVATTLAFAVRPLGRLLRGKPMLMLLPDGLVVRDRFVDWDEIVKVELDQPYAESRVAVELTSAWRWRRRVVLRDRMVHANIVYLMDLIGYYLQHPDRRAEIGTTAEAARVTLVLWQARLAAPDGRRPVPVAA